MSLHYVIDGYNVVRHASFVPKGHAGPAVSLISCIRNNRLCGSMKNKVTIVFDGYPTMNNPLQPAGDCELVFSQDDSADDRIREIVEHIANPKIVIVITDDRSVQFHAKAAGASVMGVEEFITAKAASAAARLQKADRKIELSSVDAARINNEFRKIWLKEK
ncbi:MAG: NYN domain-containing protein [Candidatus Omnitrophota bacterium]